MNKDMTGRLSEVYSPYTVWFFDIVIPLVTNLEVMSWPVTGGECLSRNKLAGVDGGETMDEQQPGGEDRDVNELAGGGANEVLWTNAHQPRPKVMEWAALLHGNETQCLDAKEVGLGKPAEETCQTLRKQKRERNQRSPYYQVTPVWESSN